MFSNVGPLRTLSYSLVSAASSNGRTYIPVKPSQFGYAQFQYVAGIPAAPGQQGVSVDKLKILNTLIDQLVTMKQRSDVPKITARGEISNEQIDTLIHQYQDQIHTAVAIAENLPYKPSMPQTGAVINLSI
ncbi:hypothetical protein K7J14_04125 [Treponema zuelzerae]|uniref:Uncharacterized protein n=1 Tax=Teretinema zuelzerae TaxID=156 RepID=A0AAE3EHH7_9SPIR|nr:hypothetical protein [Teretinema zuelzerae]MCD1653886.1 hypothetical protein [Teretinema zuelzerae]